MNECEIGDEVLIQKLHSLIRFAVRVLAIIMTAVIIWGVIDVGWVLYEKLITPPKFLLTISDILDTFGAFMAVLIAIEIFVNISIYLKEEVIHVQIVMATALMAIARKIIILDFTKISSDYVWAMAGVIFSMSIGYFLVLVSSQKKVTEFNRIFIGDNHQTEKEENRNLTE
ncbi:MAG: phosphate-starvation-inducible PsiE family protein [Desulfamplus sp.]|nr:phosphate-starvation-inducible PsiE family protein [Desulfamplus sp.]